MKNVLQAAIKVNDRIVIEIDSSISRVAAIKDGTLFKEELTPTGDILLRRLEDEKT